MSDLPKKLRHFAAMRKQLGGHPVGYEYFIEAAEEIEQLRKTVKNLQFHNRGLQQAKIEAVQNAFHQVAYYVANSYDGRDITKLWNVGANDIFRRFCVQFEKYIEQLKEQGL